MALLRILRRDFSSSVQQAGGGERKRRFVVEVSGEAEDVVHYPDSGSTSQPRRAGGRLRNVSHDAGGDDEAHGGMLPETDEEARNLAEAIAQSVQTFEQEHDSQGAVDAASVQSQ